MFFLFSAIMLLRFLETLGAYRPHVDINRFVNDSDITVWHNTPQLLKLLTAEYTYYNRLHPAAAAHITSNDAGFIESGAKTPPKIYQPREDPRLFYQSDDYTKYYNVNKVNNEVSAIYPGRDVIRANERHYSSRFDRMRRRGQSLTVTKDGGNGGSLCIRCPRDRTLVAKGGSTRVLLQSPRLVSCSGRPAPRNVHFTHMYGPAFRTLLGEGSHTIVGRVTQGNMTLQHCKMQIDVILQACHVPKYLESRCDDRHSKCNFTCRDVRLKLQGHSSLLCGGDLKWNGPLPLCKAPSCASLPPPPQDRVSCQGVTVGQGSALAEGSRCRLRCPRGWRSNTRGAPSVCRQGAWTKPMTCLPKSHNILTNGS